MISRPATTRLGQRGFTLIEILVVVVIIGTLVTAIMVRTGSFSQGDRRLREEVRRFDVLMNLAWEQAQIEGRSIGIKIDRDRFSFYSYDPLQRQWTTMENDDLFRTRELMEGIDLDLRMENQSVELPTDDGDDDEDTDINPQILLLASGEATPFNLYVEADFTDVDIELVVDVLGESEIIEHDRGF